MMLIGSCSLYTAVPGEPTSVTLLEAVKDHMVVGWAAPENNGGADVRGYFVDYRSVKGNVVGKWHEMNQKALTTTSYKVSSLPSQNHTLCRMTAFGFRSEA